MLDQAVEKLPGLDRFHDGVERPGGAESVPEAVVIDEGTLRGGSPAVDVGVDCLTIRRGLAHVGGVEEAAVEVGIEGHSFMLTAAGHYDGAQGLVPGLQRFRLDLVEVLSFHFFPVLLGLGLGDEGGGHLQLDHQLLARRPRKLEHSHAALGALVPGCGRLVKFAVDVHDLLAVLPVLGRGSEGAVVVIDHLSAAAVGPGVQNHVGRRGICREGEAEDGRVVSGGNLHLDPRGLTTVQGHTVVVGLGDLVLMTEIAGALSALVLHIVAAVIGGGGIGREGIGAAGTDPVAGHMGDLDALKGLFRSHIVVWRVDVVALAGLSGAVGHRCPVVEAVGYSHDGCVEAPGGIVALGVGAAEDVDVVGQILIVFVGLVENPHVVEIDGDFLVRLGVVVGIARQNLFDSLAIGHLSQLRIDLEPVVRGHDPGIPLGLGRDLGAVLVHGVEL